MLVKVCTFCTLSNPDEVETGICLVVYSSRNLQEKAYSFLDFEIGDCPHYVGIILYTPSMPESATCVDSSVWKCNCVGDNTDTGMLHI